MSKELRPAQIWKVKKTVGIYNLAPETYMLTLSLDREDNLDLWSVGNFWRFPIDGAGVHLYKLVADEITCNAEYITDLDSLMKCWDSRSVSQSTEKIIMYLGVIKTLLREKPGGAKYAKEVEALIEDLTNKRKTE